MSVNPNIRKSLAQRTGDKGLKSQAKVKFIVKMKKHEASIPQGLQSSDLGSVGVLVLRKTAEWLSIYIWGYLGLSLGWLVAPLIFNILR